MVIEIQNGVANSVIENTLRIIKNDSFTKLDSVVKEDVIAFLSFYEVKDEPYRTDVNLSINREIF